jgi:hypothetical protein
MMEYATHKFGIADIDWLALHRVGDSTKSTFLVFRRALGAHLISTRIDEDWAGQR